MEKVRDKCKIKKAFKMQGKVYMGQKYLQIYHQTLIFKGKYSSPATWNSKSKICNVIIMISMLCYL